MSPAFWLFAGLALAAFALAAWPFGPYQATLALASRLKRFPPAPAPGSGDGRRLKVAACCCAYNEASVIRDKALDLLRAQDAARAAGSDLDVLIYVDGSDDGTAEALEPYRDRIDVVVSPERLGKTHGMKLLVERAKGADVVAFTDANVRTDPNFAAVLRRCFADEAVGCVCSDLRYVNQRQGATAEVGGLYWRLNEASRGLETATGSALGGDGSLFAARRKLYRAPPRGMIDDLYVPLAILAQGHRVIRCPELRAYEEHATDAAAEFRRKARISCECWVIHKELWPELKRSLDAWHLYKYVGNRVLRWLGGTFLALAGLFGWAALAAAVGPGLALALAGLGAAAFFAALKAGSSPAAKLWNVALAFAGVTWGVWRAMAGKRATRWTPPPREGFAGRSVASSAPPAVGAGT